MSFYALNSLTWSQTFSTHFIFVAKDGPFSPSIVMPHEYEALALLCYAGWLFLQYFKQCDARPACAIWFRYWIVNIICEYWFPTTQYTLEHVTTLFDTLESMLYKCLTPIYYNYKSHIV